jgi:diamine N-acetyltransferase
MATVTLRDVTKENWQECIKLKLAPEQEDFVASNTYSLAESKFMPTFVPQAIYATIDGVESDTMVGFVMYGFYPDGVAPYGQRHWIFRLMIDRAYQGLGYGTAALHVVLQRLEADPACPDVLIGYEAENTVAAKLYQRLGFAVFGIAPWNETVALRATPSRD